MLKSLTVRRYALIEELHLAFGPGLNILTGETGAGKSILLGAIGLILGERAHADVVRRGADKTVVEALFDVPPELARDVLARSDDEPADSLLLRREVTAAGKSRCFVNDSPVTLAQLSLLGDRLVDLHGQHEHQALLRTERHLDTLDAFGAHPGPVREVREAHRKCRALESEWAELVEREKRLKDQRELLEFQLRELDAADPGDGEDEALEREERLLRNGENVARAAEEVRNLAVEGEGAALEKWAAAEAVLRGLAGVDPSFPAWSAEAEAVRIQVQELVRAVSAFAGRIEFDPQRLEQVRERLGLFARLKKKYGGSMEAVRAHRANAAQSLARIETLDGEIRGLAEALAAERERFALLCLGLSASRAAAAAELERRTVEALADLGLPQAVFRIRIERRPAENGPVRVDGRSYAAGPAGMDAVEFDIALNPGESPKPLVQVASGGEVSRIMLALKSVLAAADAVPVLIFDEIDTGISGRVARVVGRRLRALGGSHQVVCITHLPQIASMGRTHFRVAKHVDGDRTFTTVQTVSEEERVLEIAKLIGGERVTDAALASARELLGTP